MPAAPGEYQGLERMADVMVARADRLGPGPIRQEPLIAATSKPAWRADHGRSSTTPAGSTIKTRSRTSSASCVHREPGHADGHLRKRRLPAGLISRFTLGGLDTEGRVTLDLGPVPRGAARARGRSCSAARPASSSLRHGPARLRVVLVGHQSACRRSGIPSRLRQSAAISICNCAVSLWICPAFCSLWLTTGLDHLRSQQAVLSIAEKWRPYRSLAASYLFSPPSSRPGHRRSPRPRCSVLALVEKTTQARVLLPAQVSFLDARVTT
jgi:hypothetical protein